MKILPFKPRGDAARRSLPEADAAVPSPLHVIPNRNSLSAEWSLKQALTAIHQRAYAKEMVFSVWPNLKEVSLKLAGLITHHFPGEKRPLLEEILDRAIAAYQAALTVETRHELFSMQAYLRVLAEAAPTIMRYAVHGSTESGRKVVWETFSAPLGKWAQRYQIKEMSFVAQGSSLAVDVNLIRYLFCAQIMGMRDMLRLQDSAQQDMFDFLV